MPKIARFMIFGAGMMQHSGYDARGAERRPPLRAGGNTDRDSQECRLPYADGPYNRLR